MKSKRMLTESDVQIGKPLPWSVVDSQGTLLLKEGMLVTSARQLSRLINQQAYINTSNMPDTAGRAATKLVMAKRDAPKKGITTFDWVGAQVDRLQSAYCAVEKGSGDGVQQIKAVAILIQKAANRNASAMMGGCTLHQGNSYTLSKSIHMGVLVEQIGKRLQVGEAARFSVICAALSHDIGMWLEQDQMRMQIAPLSQEQRALIQSHPGRGVEKLRAAGVVDKAWLSCVGMHHERADGSGYPEGIKGEAIIPPARMIAVADIYAAMTRQRGDRIAMTSKGAQKEVFLSRGEMIDATMAQIFIKEIGIFSPGNFVLLANGEVGVVSGRGGNAATPEVSVIIVADGRALLSAQGRDTSDKNCSVVNVIPCPDHPDLQKVLDTVWELIA
ncbi:MAG: HD domain-containing phosphohydrolase [Motiliproteus sp.]